MASVDYEDIRVNDPRKGPKGKLPAVEVNGKLIGDSELIRYKLEEISGFDFDAGLSDEQKAVSHAMARMIEERLYWAIVHTRWLDDESFGVIRQSFFDSMPLVVRSIVPIVARRQVRGYLHGHGLGRHKKEEVLEFARRDIDALSTFLAGKPFMMGDQPSSLDATAYAHLANVAVPEHRMNPLRAMVHGHANLMEYIERCRLIWFPDYPSATA